MLSTNINDQLRMELGIIPLAEVDSEGNRIIDTDSEYTLILDEFGNQQFNTEVTPIVLLDVKFTTGGSALKYTDCPYDFTDGNNGTYSADGTIIAISPPKSEGVIDRDIFSFTLADPNFALKTRFDTQSTGVECEIRVKLINSNLEVIPGEIGVFKGNISAIRYYIEGDLKSAKSLIDVTCTGPLAKLQQVTERLTTQESQQAVHPNDTCFNRSFDTQNQSTIRWGS